MDLTRTRAIPTRVGKSEFLDLRPPVPAGHPHAGGEISRRWGRSCAGAGPSPRGWGNRLRRFNRHRPRRAIPTRVGKSNVVAVDGKGISGHPHAGGEIPDEWPGAGTGDGPSPRGWGNLGSDDLVSACSRAIPTRVGKSEGPAGAVVQGGGPSPRGWGNRSTAGGAARRTRAIPTRVGKSVIGVLRPPRSAGHPHAGGEIQAPSASGCPARAIPTRVGKSGPHSGRHTPRAGHPHAGGEIASVGGRSSFASGPSPRGWGNPRPGSSRPPGRRAIPTRVGKSRL